MSPASSSEAPSSSEVKTVSTLLFLASASNGSTAQSTFSPLSFTRPCLFVLSVSCVLFCLRASSLRGTSFLLLFCVYFV